MSSYQNVSGIIDLIPFVNQLKDTFFNLVNMDDNSRSQLKFLAEQNEHIRVRPLFLALEQWEQLQNKFGAPGVDKDYIICDNNALQEVMESSSILNKIILEIMCEHTN